MDRNTRHLAPALLVLVGLALLVIVLHLAAPRGGRSLDVADSTPSGPDARADNGAPNGDDLAFLPPPRPRRLTDETQSPADAVAPDEPSDESPESRPPQFFYVGPRPDEGEAAAESLTRHLKLTVEQLQQSEAAVDQLAESARKVWDIRQEIGRAVGRLREQLKDQGLTPEQEAYMLQQERMKQALARQGGIIQAYDDAMVALEMLRPYMNDEQSVLLDHLLERGRDEKQRLLEGER